MKTRRDTMIILVGTLGSAVSLQSAEKTSANKPWKVKPSKVSPSKRSVREKQFSDWLSHNDLRRQNEEKLKAGEQMVYFEYHEGRKMYRGLYSKAIRFDGWWWETAKGEQDMEDTIDSYRQRGYVPLFVVLQGNFYSLMCISAKQLPEAQAVLQELGIEPPELK